MITHAVPNLTLPSSPQMLYLSRHPKTLFKNIHSCQPETIYSDMSLPSKWGCVGSVGFGTHRSDSGLEFRGKMGSIHRKGSMSISRAEQGMVSSKRVMTSGCRTPRRPTLFPLTKTSAQRPGKKVESSAAWM